MLGFWIFMLVMTLLIPSVMIGFGFAFIKQAPKNINYIFGYRTAMSMKNKETWAFAHQYCGKLWYRLGLLLLPLSILPMVLVFGRDKDFVGLVGSVITLIQLVPLIGSIIPTEIALKRTFDADGNRKH